MFCMSYIIWVRRWETYQFKRKLYLTFRETNAAEIPYWWRDTTQICVVLLIGWNKFHGRHDQSETLPMQI